MVFVEKDMNVKTEAFITGWSVLLTDWLCLMYRTNWHCTVVKCSIWQFKISSLLTKSHNVLAVFTCWQHHQIHWHKFIHLVGLLTTGGSSCSKVKCWISYVALVMGRWCQIWHDRDLHLDAKIQLYQALFLSVLLCAAETWTFLAAEWKDIRSIS